MKMGMTKYADVELAEVLSPQEHKRIGKTLNEMGKTSARDLTAKQRTALRPKGPMRRAFEGVTDRPTARRLGSP